MSQQLTFRNLPLNWTYWFPSAILEPHERSIPEARDQWAPGLTRGWFPHPSHQGFGWLLLHIVTISLRNSFSFFLHLPMLFYLIHIYAYIYMWSVISTNSDFPGCHPRQFVATTQETLLRHQMAAWFFTARSDCQHGALISCIWIGVSTNGVPEMECLEGKIYLSMDDLVVPLALF